MLERYMNHLVGGSYEMFRAGMPYLRKSTAPRGIFMTAVEGYLSVEGFKKRKPQ